MCSPVPNCACYDPEDDPTPCHEQRLFARLVAWMQEGVDAHIPEEERAGLPRLADALALRRTPRREGGYRAVVTTHGLRAGELLMRIPMQRLMHAGFFKSAAHSPLAAALAKGLEGRELSTFVATQTWLAAYMLEQRRLGQRSEWSPYLDMLPEEFHSVPLFYSEEDLRWLNGSLFLTRVRRHRENLEKQYDTVEELVPGFASNYSLDDFLWARSAISSRVFGWSLPGMSSEDTDFMVPLGDMFNHRSPKQVEWVFNKTARTLDYRALEDVPAGAELLISYGGKCNSQYLLHYGFTMPNVSKRWPPVSTVRVNLDLDAEVPDREARERWLLKSRLQDPNGKLAPEEFELKANTWKNSGAEHMLAYARLLALPGGPEFDRAVKGGRVCRQFTTPPRCDQPMNSGNERAALRRCLRALEAALAAYPTSLEEDEELLPTLTGLPRMLVTLRRDEKVVLRWWLRFFELALKGLELPPDEFEVKVHEAFGQFSPEGQYLRVALPALLTVERKRGAEPAKA